SGPPREPVGEAWFLGGRRGGKSRFASAIGIDAASRTYALAPGERAVVGIAASDRAQAAVVMSYAASPFRESALRPLVQQSRWDKLRALVERETRTQIDLKTGVSTELS